MATIDRMLIPTDFSDSAERAYSFAGKLAREYGGVIDLLHVIPSVIYLDEQLRSKTDIPDLEEEYYPHLFNEAEMQLKKLMKTHFDFENRGEIYVKVDRKPSELISRHAEDGNYSIIIMMAKGKHQSAMFRGSTTEQLVRRSKVPVFTITEDSDINEVRTIVVPTDGSLLSIAAMPSAIKLATALGASITLLYVNETYGLISNHFSSKASHTRNREIEEHIAGRLKEFSKESSTLKFTMAEDKRRFPLNIVTGVNGKNRSVEVQIDILTGFSAHHEITEYSNKHADIVIMTTHGRSGLAHLVMGSIAEKVALNVEKPILMILPYTKLFKKNRVES